LDKRRPPNPGRLGYSQPGRLGYRVLFQGQGGRRLGTRRPYVRPDAKYLSPLLARVVDLPAGRNGLHPPGGDCEAAVSRQPSAVSHQLSAISRQPSAVSFRLAGFVGKP